MPRLRDVGYHESRKTAALLNVSIPPHPEVSVIVPARNEAACLADCLRSLAGQDGPSYEVIVVDDQSTDATHSIAESFPVRVISADPLPPGWSGKCNAVWSGAKAARGQWLLFTDADTKHSPHSISAGLSEAAGFDAALLSYSPKQEVRSFAERALMPVIFAELAVTYRPKMSAIRILRWPPPTVNICSSAAMSTTPSAAMPLWPVPSSKTLSSQKG